MNRNDFTEDVLYCSIYKLLCNAIKSFGKYVDNFMISISEFENVYSSNTSNDDKNKINEYLFVKEYIHRLIYKIEYTLETEFKNCMDLIQMDNKIYNKLVHGFISIDRKVNEVTPPTLLKYILEMMVTNYIITKKIDDTKINFLVSYLSFF